MMNTITRTRPIAGLFNNILKAHYGIARENISENLTKMVKNSKVVVFMKGVPEQPRCGFSNAVVQIMRMHGVQYDAHDVLKDEILRQGIKEFSDWPTIPQVYINGEFVGGCDILLQMHQSGDLVETLEKAGIRSALLDKDKEATAGSGTKDNK